MKRVVNPAGYTIVETIIFLAVSALLFVSASILISGRQRKTQFAVTVRDFSSKVKSVYGNVASGYYNSSGQVTCTVSGGAISTLSSGGNDQGTNSDCVYLGQVLVSPQSGTNDFKIVSLVGLRNTTGSPPQEVQNLSDAKPKLYTETAETYSLAGAEFVSIYHGSTQVGTTSDGSSVAFISSLAHYNSNKLQSEASHTDVYTIDSNNTSTNGLIESTLGDSSSPAVPTTDPITFCLSDGDQRAKVTLINGISSYQIGDVTTCS